MCKNKKLYECPYNKAIKCDMTLPCRYCEDFKPLSHEQDNRQTRKIRLFNRNR